MKAAKKVKDKNKERKNKNKYGMDELDKLSVLTQENAWKLKERISIFKNNYKKSYRDICKSLGWHQDEQAPDEHKLSNFCGDFYNRWKTAIPEYYFKEIVRWMIENGYWYNKEFQEAIIGDREHFMYHALVAWMGVGEKTEEEMKNELVGDFRVFRPSVYLNDHYVIGRRQIKYHPEHYALEVEETYGLQPISSKLSQNFRSLGEVYNGYICRKNQHYYLITRDIYGDRFNHTSLPHLRRGLGLNGEKQIVLMYGQTIGVFDGRVYTTRIMYERIDKKKPDWGKKIGVFSKDDIPKPVSEFLSDNISDQPYKIL